MNTSKELGFIKLPIDPQAVAAAISFTGTFAETAGFSQHDSRKIQLAVEEACLNVIHQSFMQDEEGEFDLRFIRRPDGIEIHVHDLGLPYNPKDDPVFDPAADLDNQNLSGLGTFLIRNTMDEYAYHNLGKDGKEMVLLKYFESSVSISNDSMHKEPEVVLPPLPDPSVPKIDFSIRLMASEESPDVCRCVYDCYGYSYANENLYYPERVAAMNLEGKLRSVVAVTGEGEIGSHCALILHEYMPAEVGIVVTKKKFRGQGFARLLTEYLEDEAAIMGLGGLQVKEVTAHPYTQKLSAKLGYLDCGLLLAHSPKSLSFKGIADQLVQRNSDVLGFKYLQKPLLRKIYAPYHHRSMIELLYNNLGDQIQCVLEDHPVPSGQNCRMEVRVHAVRSMAEIFVMSYGEDTMVALRNEMRRIFRDEIQVIEMYLSLADPMTPVMVPQMESLGFIFTGVLPETRQGDSIVLQYFNGAYIDYDQIVLVSDVAKELLAYIRQFDKR